MNSVALYFASGESLYTGAALLVMVVVASPFFKVTWFFRLATWVSIALIVMACPPFPLALDLMLLAIFVLWFITASRPPANRMRMRLQRSSTVVLVLLLLVSTAIEFCHRRMPVISGMPTDHLVVIGDSISSGTDPHVPSWPLVLQQLDGVTVKNLARPGAQVSDASVMAEKLMAEDRLVLIEIGGNDLLMGASANQFSEDLDALLSKVTTPGRTVVMFELPLLPNKIEYGRIQLRLAERYGVSLIPKRYLVEVIGGALATSDGLHLTAVGSRHMAAFVAQLLSPILKAT